MLRTPITPTGPWPKKDGRINILNIHRLVDCNLLLVECVGSRMNLSLRVKCCSAYMLLSLPSTWLTSFTNQVPPFQSYFTLSIMTLSTRWAPESKPWLCHATVSFQFLHLTYESGHACQDTNRFYANMCALGKRGPNYSYPILQHTRTKHLKLPGLWPSLDRTHIIEGKIL
jgi:hypothetical protein